MARSEWTEADGPLLGFIGAWLSTSEVVELIGDTSEGVRRAARSIVDQAGEPSEVTELRVLQGGASRQLSSRARPRHFDGNDDDCDDFAGG